MNKKKKMFLGRSSGVWGSSYRQKKDEPKTCFNCKKLGHVVGDCPDLQKDKSEKESSKEENFKNIVKKSLMGRWENLDAGSGEEEANMALMASTSSDADSNVDAEDDDDLFFELNCEELITVVKDLIRNYQSK